MGRDSPQGESDNLLAALGLPLQRVLQVIDDTLLLRLHTTRDALSLHTAEKKGPVASGGELRAAKDRDRHTQTEKEREQHLRSTRVKLDIFM